MTAQQLPVGVQETLEWEGVHIPFGPKEFEVTANLQDKDIGHLAHASKNGICVRMRAVELSRSPHHDVEENGADACLHRE